MREPGEGIEGEGEGGVEVMGENCWELQGFRTESDGAAERQGQPADSRPITRRHRQQIRRIAGSHRRGEGGGGRTRGIGRAKRGGGEGDSALGGRTRVPMITPVTFALLRQNLPPFPSRIETPHVATTRACVNRETSRPAS